MDRHATRLLEAIEREGVLLQHDQVLPSASAVVAGEPVRGSWWAHPMANPIYDALNAVEDAGHAVRVKLVAGKVTMVARPLWPALLAVGRERADWQTSRLTKPERKLLAVVEASSEAVLLDPSTREAGRRLEATLLIATDEVHLPSGRHTKALLAWEAWAAARGVEPSVPAGDARAAFEAIVARWHSPKWLLPWPPS